MFTLYNHYIFVFLLLDLSLHEVQLLYKLLLPQEDKTRSFGLKQKQIINVLSVLFEVDRDKMLQFLNKTGSVSKVAAHYFESSEFSKQKNIKLAPMYIVDNLLDCFALATTNSKRVDLFVQFFKLTPSKKEVDYFVRLLEKKLNIKAGASQLLRGFSLAAKEAYENTNDLSNVINHFYKQAHNINSDEPAFKRMKKTKTFNYLSIQPFKPVKPMLAKACKNYTTIPIKKLITELKYDGERIQIHKKDNRFRYFSGRSLKDFPVEKLSDLEPFILQACSKANTLILDAEIVLVDTKTHKQLPFGSLNKNKKKEYSNAQTCIYVFDIMFFEGEDVCDKPYSERHSLIHDNIVFTSDRVMPPLMYSPKTTEEIYALMQRITSEGFEGLVMKDVFGKYIPGKRKWLKLKRDYMLDKNWIDSADLVLLGGYYGTGSMGGKVCSCCFLLKLLID